MKKTLLFLGVFTSVIANAQFTQANEPAIGDSQTMFMCDTSVSNLSTVTGGTAVWDFSKCARVNTGATKIVSAKTPTDVSAEFPNATKAIDIQDYLTSFFSSSSTQRNSKGMRFVQPAPLGTVNVIFNNTNNEDEKVMEYPYDFGNSHSDDFKGQVKSTAINTTCTGHGNFSVDGKGTLKLNAATTLTNVLRYKLVDTVDAVLTTPFAVTLKIIRTQYEYYDLANSKELPVFIYATLRITSTGQFTTDVKQKIVLNSVQPDGFIGIAEQNELNLSVYPNPTTGIIKLSGLTSDAVVTITDLQGKVVYTNTVSNGEMSIAEFQAGVYVMEVVSAEGKAVQRIVKN